MRDAQLDELSGWIAQRDMLHPRTSSWSIGQQVEHCCLVIQGVREELGASQPPVPGAKISLVRRGVFLSGRIPRGRARAPKSVHPAPLPDGEHLRTCVQRARQHVQEIRALDPDAWLRHFIFDVLARDEALHFLRIHTNHHLRIMRQIARRC